MPRNFCSDITVTGRGKSKIEANLDGSGKAPYLVRLGLCNFCLTNVGFISVEIVIKKL